MTKDDILFMAREAGFSQEDHHAIYNMLERFATLVEDAATAAANARANNSWALMCKKMVAAEREACAKVVLGIANDDAGNPYKQALRIGAAAIRARSET